MEAIQRENILFRPLAFRFRDIFRATNETCGKQEASGLEVLPGERAFRDCHTHCLPGIDDGAANVEMALALLQQEQEQGIREVVVTPHFYPHQESLDSFLERRERAYQALCRVKSDALPSVRLGAEVYLLRDVVQEAQLASLCLEGTRCLLLELPYRPVEDWVFAAIENIEYKYRVRPVLAHLDRYRDFLTAKDLERLLSIEDVVCQINSEALQSRSSLSFVLSLVKRNVLLLFGSDCHNLEDRPPDLRRGLDALRAKIGKQEFVRLMDEAEAIFAEEKC